MKPFSKHRLGLLCAVLLTAVGCGGGATTPSPTPTPNPNPPPGGSTQTSVGHVILLVEENHGYASVVSNNGMPYLDGLASRYGSAAQYYSNTHPSIGNYFMLTTGQIITNDDSFTGTVSDDNMVREFVAAGKTWKSYAENLPSVGYTGGDVPPYSKRHNPFVYLSDVIGTSQANNVVPFSQLTTDLASGQLPQFSYIVPNLNDDAHDGTLQQADTWLQQNIDPLIQSATFQKDGLLIITFDEAEDTDLQNGGGHIATVVISPLGKNQYQSSTMFQHQSVLRFILNLLGVTTFPGAAATAPDMSEFLTN